MKKAWTGKLLGNAGTGGNSNDFTPERMRRFLEAAAGVRFQARDKAGKYALMEKAMRSSGYAGRSGSGGRCGPGRGCSRHILGWCEERSIRLTTRQANGFIGPATKPSCWCSRRKGQRLVGLDFPQANRLNPNSRLARSSPPPLPMHARIHERMPAILQPSDYGVWLDAQISAPALLSPLLAPNRAFKAGEELEMYRARATVNRAENDTPDCIAAV